MILQLLLSFAPFLALLYLVFALVQALRHKQQGIFAALLALVALGVPVAAYLTASAVIQARILTRLPTIAVILFVASLLILLIERRNKERDPGRSYGMLGIGLSIVFALAMFAAPLLTASTATNTETAATAQDSSENTSADNTLVNVSRNTTVEDTAAQATPSADSAATEPTAVALAVTAQTGLSTDEITTQIEAGSTIADLVAANNGDLDAVVDAIAAALDEMSATSGMDGQMLSRLGSDTTEIATQFVRGELGQAQQFLLPVLLTGEMPQFSGGRGGVPPGDGAQGEPPDAEATPEAASFVPLEPASDETSGSDAEATAVPSADDGATVNQARDVAAQATPEPPATAVPVQVTEPVIRPTRIVFPTATPTPEATFTLEATEQESGAESSDDSELAADLSAITCVLVVNYNLNLRDQPTQEGSTILLSIPFGMTVSADAVTEDGWYSVSYDGSSGWVTGEYVTPSASCADLPVDG